MEIADHIACLRSEGELLAEAAERSPLTAPVPGRPGWRLWDLLAHLGFVHRWATRYVAEGRTEATSGPGEEEIIRLAPADESLVGWFRAGHARLVSVLAAADPATRCWTFMPAPSPLAFWARRQAHETAIHRVDAQLAAAAAVPGADLDPFPAGLAADGVDELLTGFGRDPGSFCDGPAVLVIRAEDGARGADWTVVMGQPRAGVSRGLDSAARAAGGWGHRECMLGLLLARSSAADKAAPVPDAVEPGGRRGGLDVRGDDGVLATWREKMQVRWD